MMDKKYIKWYIWRILAVGLTLGFIVSGAYAQSGEVSLSQADALIAAKKYDSAIKVLTEYGKKNPRDFDKVQKRLQQIVKIRDEYNDLTEQLLNVLKNSPDDSEAIIALTQKIENLEPEPNEFIGGFIAKTKDLALFTYNRAQLDNVLTEGRALLDNRDYAGALTMYSSGMELYKKEFYDAKYGDMVYAQVEENLRQITAGTGNFSAANTRLNSALAEFERVAAQNTGSAGLNAIARAYTDLEEAALNFMNVRNTMAKAGEAIKIQSDLIRQIDDSRGDASFLPFILRLLEGRAGQDVPEGMIGTMDTVWSLARNQVEERLTGIAGATYDNARSMGRQNQFSRSDQEFNAAVNYSTFVTRTVLWESRKEGLQLPGFIVIAGEVVADSLAPVYYQYYSMQKSIPHIIAAQNNQNRFNVMVSAGFNSVEEWRSGALQPSAAMVQEQDNQAWFSRFETEMGSYILSLEETGLELNEIKNSILAAFDYNVYLGEARLMCETLVESSFVQQRESVERRYTIANGEMEKRRDQKQSQFNEAVFLMAGESRPDLGTNHMAKYPAEAGVILTSLVQTLPADIRDAQTLVGQYSSETLDIQGTPEVTALLGGANSILNDLLSLENTAQSASREAQTSVAQANSLRLDGDRLYQEALAALSQNNFETARDRIERSAAQYSASLNIQESVSLRTQRDERVVSLGQDIIRRQNELVLVEVRRLIEQSKTEYYAGNFERADDTLTRAKNLYSNTNTTENTEITYWQGIVKNALSVRSGKTIPTTAPLYSEMSQLLRDAHLAYDEGSRLLNQGRRNDGIAKLNEARSKIKEVKLIFPLNEDAGILDLRIDQVIDPAAFNAGFGTRMNTAFNAVQTTRSAEAYTDLQNLAAINPTYPNMQNLLYQAGVTMGLIIPPPSAAAVAESTRLTNQARQIVDTNIQGQLGAAKTLLSEAIRLNPANATATRLMDEVNSRMGGSVSPVLSAAAEALYQEALTDYQNKLNFIALQKVNQLLEDPNNRNSSKILALQQRIQSSL